MSKATQKVENWYARCGWTPFEFQRQVWRAYLDGESGLLHAPTGTGKTLAVWLGPVMEALSVTRGAKRTKSAKPQAAAPLTALWITPLRALANDTLKSLSEPVTDLKLNWTIELRTGDITSSQRARQNKRLPSALITTPESLSLLLSYPDAAEKFATLRCVIVDEWHELIGTKRGVQTELCLARLRQWLPNLRTWGLSATLGNLGEARDVLIGNAPVRPPKLIEADLSKALELRTLIPADIERFPWAGHLGVKLLDEVIASVERAQSTLLFTNTRSQAELWFRSILRARPDWIGQVAIHHGSLDRDIRRQVEDLLRRNKLKAVVCTSSLDLGVDFSPVDQVMQLGSPKGVGRLMQRAGRSGHQPGATSRIIGVPTHAFELVEFAAAKQGLNERRSEARPPLELAMDVLVQHIVTVALGGGFESQALLDEVRRAWAYRDLTEEQWQWALEFVTRGGPALRGYPQYARVVEKEGRYTVAGPRIARLHRMAIGTITSDTAMLIKFMNGRTIGSVEESFISRLNEGDRFIFAGRSLELVRIRDMSAYVKPVKGRQGVVPRWQGARFPLSTQMADLVRMKLLAARQGSYGEPEMRAVEPMLRLQAEWSIIPGPGELLVESAKTRDGHHQFIYPFEGRLVHEGLGALMAYRLTRKEPRSIAVNFSDYGIELLSPQPMTLSEADWRELLAPERMSEDLLACLNATQMARRQFREIARVAGLIFSGYPGQSKSMRQLQASSDLFYDVLHEFDPRNLLLEQARREVFEQQLEVRRLIDAMARVAASPIIAVHTPKLTPLAFPIWADRLRQQQLSSERWDQRVRRMAEQLERAASRGATKGTKNPKDTKRKTKKKVAID